MIEVILFALIFSKIKGYKIKPLFSTWVIYPILITQSILVFFQISVFCDTYYFVQFAPIIQKAIILSFIFPIFAFKLYKPAIIGSASILFGTVLNNFVIAQNDGKMPVFPSFSYITGYISPDSFGVADKLHILGSDTTQYKFLTDYIDLGYSILSIGDVFIHFFSFLMIFYTIKAINQRRTLKSKIFNIIGG